MVINVEMIGTGLVIQPYEAMARYCRMNSISDVFILQVEVDAPWAIERTERLSPADGERIVRLVAHVFPSARCAGRKRWTC